MMSPRSQQMATTAILVLTWALFLDASKICGIIGMMCKVPSYFRDIYVWLPDERCGMSMPTCSHCLSNQVVGVHG